MTTTDEPVEADVVGDELQVSPEVVLQLLLLELSGEAKLELEWWNWCK